MPLPTIGGVGIISSGSPSGRPLSLRPLSVRKHLFRTTPYICTLCSAGHLSRYVTSHPGQLSLAIPSWVGAIRQRAVTPCG